MTVFALKIKLFNAVAFLLASKFIAAFELLSDDDGIPGEMFVCVIESTHIGIHRGKYARRRRGERIFSIELWNVRKRVLQNLPRPIMEQVFIMFYDHHYQAYIQIYGSYVQNEENLTETKIIAITRKDQNIQRKNTKELMTDLNTLSNILMIMKSSSF